MNAIRAVRVSVVVLALAALAGDRAASSQGSAPVPQDAPPPVSLPPAFERVLRDYEAAWRDGDGARLAALFTEDGFAIQSGRPIARGRDAIARAITGPGGALQLTAYAHATAGDVGYIVGGYRYPDTRGPGGRFVLALRADANGRWLIAADLDNAGPRQ